MSTKSLVSILRKYDLWRLIGISLGGGIVVVTGALVFELAALIWQNNATPDTSSSVKTIDSDNLSAVLDPNTMSLRELDKALRTGLFKPATPSRDKPMADKTIERIRSQLQLKCITNLNGKLVAYIKIQGVGLRKCEPGDTVNDLFTVVNVQKNSVEIEIVGHKTRLDL